MAKTQRTTFTATSRTGKTFTTKSVRDVAFAVISAPSAERIAEFEKLAAGGGEWYAAEAATYRALNGAPCFVTWTSRADLAEKQAAKERRDPWLSNIEIVPAVAVEDR